MFPLFRAGSVLLIKNKSTKISLVVVLVQDLLRIDNILKCVVYNNKMDLKFIDKDEPVMEIPVSEHYLTRLELY